MNFTDFYNSSQSAVSYATTIVEVILLIRLAWLGLLWEFKLFSLFIAFDASFTVALIGLDYHLYSYEWIWTVVTPVWTLFLAGASLELIRGLVQPIPRERISRTAALYGFLVGMTVSVALSMWTHAQAIMRSTAFLMTIGRTSILCGCLVAILFQGAILLIGGAPIMSNWKFHRRILITYIVAFVSASFAIETRNIHLAESVSLLSNISLLGCFCAWTLSLRPLFVNAWAGIHQGMPTDAQLAEAIVFDLRSRVGARKQTRITEEAAKLASAASALRLSGRARNH
jgi:hypothetical protein